MEIVTFMKIELITIWYNEEFLAPFFLNHYSWVDKIHLIVDADTNDSTVSIASRYQNVEIEYLKFPDMWDDNLKAIKFNEKYTSITDADYVILVDSDEFIFCNQLDMPVRSHIENTRKDVYFVHLWQIYKHEDDPPLDPGLPVPLQRRHGDPDMSVPENLAYVKPVVIRAGKDIQLALGNHALKYDGIVVSLLMGDKAAMREKNVSVERHEMLQGAHWRLVDLDEAVKRRIQNRKQRLSKVNLTKGFSSQYHNITEEDIIREYNDNKQRPVVIR